MNPIRHIIFDFDGTLVDTAPLIIATMQATIRELHLPARSDENCRATIGLRLEDVPAALWSDMDGLGKKYAETYRRIFNVLKRPLKVECYPNVVPTLRKLHELGFDLAIASSRNRSSLLEYAEEFEISDLFCAMVGGDDVTHGKPAPEPVLILLERFNWNADECLVVGDAAVDIMMGKNAAAHTCAVSYGNQEKSVLAAAEPDFIIDTFPQLCEVVGI